MQKPPLTIEELELFFKSNHAFLCLAALSIVKDKDVAKDIVQDFFISYWERRKNVQFPVSFKAYAVRAIKNLSLQHVQKVKKEQSLVNQLVANIRVDEEKPQKIGNKKRLQELIDRLPESRRKIFISYVIYGQSYSEIAENNGVSVNTVKTQMKRAYRFLRSEANPDLLYFCLVMFEIF